MKRIFPIILIALFWTCTKVEEPTPLPITPVAESCSTNSGNFNISINGGNHVMVLNDQSHFSILYN
jgi:hypothetical protein